MPSPKDLTVVNAVDALAHLMASNDVTTLIQSLEMVPDINIVAAANELLFLDFFTIYFGIKFTRESGWRERGRRVFDRLFAKFVDLLKSDMTEELALQSIQQRISAYSLGIEKASSILNPQHTERTIGEVFALLCGLRSNIAVILVGAAAFSRRIEMLHVLFNTNKLID